MLKLIHKWIHFPFFRISNPWRLWTCSWKSSAIWRHTVILLINSWLYVEFEVDRINYLTEKETNWFLPAARVYRFPQKIENILGYRMIKQLLNSVIAKYRDLSVSRSSIICLSLRLRQIIDLLATDKSRYFAQPRPIIVNYLPFMFCP